MVFCRECQRKVENCSHCVDGTCRVFRYAESLRPEAAMISLRGVFMKIRLRDTPHNRISHFHWCSAGVATRFEGSILFGQGSAVESTSTTTRFTRH